MSEGQGAGGQPAGDLSMRDMAGLARGLQNGTISDQQIERVWNSIDEETKQQSLSNLLEQFVLPHVDDVRERSLADADPATIRAQYASLSDDEQQQVFNQAVSDVVGTLFEVREDPREGLMSLKGLLRDPYTIEGLLLIFDNEQHITPEYSEQMKDFAAMHLRWMGVALAPEMYDEQAVREVYSQLDLPTDHDPRA